MLTTIYVAMLKTNNGKKKKQENKQTNEQNRSFRNNSHFASILYKPIFTHGTVYHSWIIYLKKSENII